MELRGTVFKDGDLVIAVDKKGRERFFRLAPGRKFSLYGRQYEHDRVLGQKEGCFLELEPGRWAYFFRPSMEQYVRHVKRNVQPIYGKDLGVLLFFADVRAGDRVLEIGLGAGALSMAILNAIGPTGELVTYERRPDFAREGRKRVEDFLGPRPNFSVVVADASLGIEERGFDAGFIDIPEPWTVLSPVSSAVKPGAFVLAFIPTTVQVKRYWDELTRMGRFFDVRIFETMLRPWDAGERSLRPAHRMVAHTGFVVMARRTLEEGRSGVN